VGQVLVNDLLFLDGRAKDDTNSIREATSNLQSKMSGLIGAVARGAEEDEVTGRVAELNEELDTPAAQRARRAAAAAEMEAERTRSAAMTVPSTSSLPRNAWVPVAFSTALVSKRSMVSFDLEDVPWLLFRGAHGEVGCIKDECAHRACPLSLGKMTTNGTVQCPYHGWEFDTEGMCQHMPSCRQLPHVEVLSLECAESGGLVWVWNGRGEQPTDGPPSMSLPNGFSTVAEVSLEFPAEQPAVVSSLLDVDGTVAFRAFSMETPGTRALRASRDGIVPFGVRVAEAFASLTRPFNLSSLIARVVRGSWEPVPAEVEQDEHLPCIITSQLGLARAGGRQVAEGFCDWDGCARHAHQTHICLPSRPGRTRVLYRLAIDFVPLGRREATPDPVWVAIARQVLQEEAGIISESARVEHERAEAGDTVCAPSQLEKVVE